MRPPSTPDPRFPPSGRLGWVIPSALAIVATSPVEPKAIGSAAILRGHSPDFFQHSGSCYSIAFTLAGRSKVECKRGRRLERFVAEPGSFSITSGGGENSYSYGNVLESLNLSIEPVQLAEIAAREFHSYAGTVELSSSHLVRPREIVALGQSFASLLRNPRPGNRLYAETLWTQIAMQLLWSHSNLPHRGNDAISRLADGRFRRVIDYMESSLSEDISLSDLANLAGLSPNYFLNAFTKATGKTPHRYLTERRLHRACELLRNPQMSIIGVALAVGFASHSHFTTVFGRYMKTTPGSYRKQVLGLGADLP